jgi:hypothetical protein
VSSLSTYQRLILATAADHADGAVLPLPDGFSVRGRARRLMLKGMIKRGLIAERPAPDDEPAWQRAMATVPARSRRKAALLSDQPTKSHPLETISRPSLPACEQMPTRGARNGAPPSSKRLAVHRAPSRRCSSTCSAGQRALPLPRSSRRQAGSRIPPGRRSLASRRRALE